MDVLNKIKDHPLFWEGAFLFAFVLMIAAHKITVEGMIGAGGK